ncbi:major capsid protein [Micromonospora sp. RV43]|uniref:major capsid protein n=1 Tax=Micromonospora sp. RV43 TaxID=1661387 RepID=UPI00064BF904|nr:major capsid protein [Micromonospora sp. RV43]
MIVDDYVEPAVLTGYVREVPAPAFLTLDRWLPNVYIADIEAAITQMEQTNRVAKFRAFDAETEVGQRDAWRRSAIRIPPVGLKLPIMEEERLKLERSRTGGNNYDAYVTAIYNDGANIARYVHNRLELARGDVLSDWVFRLQGEGKQYLEADFGMPVGHNKAAGVLWSNHANSSPLTDLTAWVKDYVDANGFRPAYMQTSSTVISNMLLSEEIRRLVGSLAGVPSMVTEDQLNQVLKAHRLPQLVEYDTRLSVDGVDTRVIAEDKVIFLPPESAPLGRTVWGITAEALELTQSQNPSLEFEQLPGLVGVVLKEGDPVRTWTKVGATAMPLIDFPKRLMVADVL